MLVTNQPTWLIMCNSFVMLAAYSVVNRTASWTARPYTTTIWFILSPDGGCIWPNTINYCVFSAYSFTNNLCFITVIQSLKVKC